MTEQGKEIYKQLDKIWNLFLRIPGTLAGNEPMFQDFQYHLRCLRYLVNHRELIQPQGEEEA